MGGGGRTKREQCGCEAAGLMLWGEGSPCKGSGTPHTWQVWVAEAGLLFFPSSQRDPLPQFFPSWVWKATCWTDQTTPHKTYLRGQDGCGRFPPGAERGTGGGGERESSLKLDVVISIFFSHARPLFRFQDACVFLSCFALPLSFSLSLACSACKGIEATFQKCKFPSLEQPLGG